MKIESIEKARKGTKFRVSLDDGTELLLSKEVIIDFGLRRNDELSEGLLSEITGAQSYRDAYFAAGRLLNYRMRTRSELEQRLQKKGYPQTVVERVLARMGEIGLLDDSKFADAFVASKISSRPVGKRMLEHGLREKGVGKEIAHEAVSRISDEETQLHLALRAAETKMRSLRRFAPDKRREKLIAFLARRGFDWWVIRKVTGKIFKGEADAVDL